MLQDIAYLTLFVRDQDRALEFYTAVLGFEKRVDRAGVGGGRFLTVGLPGQTLEVILWPGTPGQAANPEGYVPGVCVLLTRDCRKALAAIASRAEPPIKVDLVEQPAALIGLLQDPDGNRIMLREPQG